MTLADDITQRAFTFSGDPNPPYPRVMTGLYSFDRAFLNAQGEIGLIMSLGYEFFGQEGTGKTTFSLSLLAMLGQMLEKNITIASIEGFDSLTASDILSWNKFSGDVSVRTKGTDQAVITKWIDDLKYGKFYTKTGSESNRIPAEDKIPDGWTNIQYDLGLLDAIGSIVTPAQEDGDVGMGYVGARRAMLVADIFPRLITDLQRNEDRNKLVIFVNHWTPLFDRKGWGTPGGTKKNYVARVRCLLRRKEEFSDGSYILEGETYKSNHTYEGRKFYVVLKTGVGIHKGLTAAFDACLMGKANRGKYVTLGDEKYPSFENLVLDHWQDENFFIPFQEALNE